MHLARDGHPCRIGVVSRAAKATRGRGHAGHHRPPALVGAGPAVEREAFSRGRFARQDPLYEMPVHRIVTAGAAGRLVVQCAPQVLC
jgi:hypothetical protein